MSLCGRDGLQGCYLRLSAARYLKLFLLISILVVQPLLLYVHLIKFAAQPLLFAAKPLLIGAQPLLFADQPLLLSVHHIKFAAQPLLFAVLPYLLRVRLRDFSYVLQKINISEIADFRFRAFAFLFRSNFFIFA